MSGGKSNFEAIVIEEPALSDVQVSVTSHNDFAGSD